MAVIFWMSTGMFAAQNTALFIEPLIRLLMPWISHGTAKVIHGLVRKSGHVTEYFILGLLLFRAFRSGSDERRLWKWALASFLVAVVYATSDEFHQSFVPTRTASLVDVGIDATGALLAQLLAVCRHFWRMDSNPKS